MTDSASTTASTPASIGTNFESVRPLSWDARLFGSLRPGYWVLVGLVVSQSLVGYVFGVTAGNIDPATILAFGDLSRRLPAWLLLPALWFAYLAFAVLRRGVARPALVMWKLTFRHRYWLLRGFLFTALAFPFARGLSAFKAAIPNLVPFYADPLFIAADKAIFGTDPWRITHAVLGPAGTAALDRVYAIWFLVMMLLLGWLNFTRNQRLQLRGLLTYAVSWILLGNILAAAFSSVGPCFYAEFYHDGYFAPLMDELRDGAQEHPIVALTVMRYLLDSLAIDRFGTGISAMPSMHVSIAFLASLVMWQGTRLLWARLLAACFTAATFIASVHLGWHYAVDGLLGVAVIALIWIGVGRFIDRLDGSASGARGTHPPA